MYGSDRTGRKGAGALFAVAFFFWYSHYAYASYLNPVLMERGMSATFMGLAGGLYGFAQLALRVPLGMLADRLNRQRLFVTIGCALALITAVGFAVSDSPAVFLIMRAMGGVSACSWVCCTILYSRCFPPEQSAGRITQLNLGSYLGRLAAYATVAALLTRMGKGVAFWVGAAGAAAALLLCAFAPEKKAERAAAGLGGMAAVLRDRTLLRCSALGAILQFAAFATEYSFSTNVQVQAGASAAQVSMFAIAMLVPSIIANGLVGRAILVGRSPRRIMAAGFLLLGLYCVLTPRVNALWQFCPVQALAGIANSCTISVLLGQCVRTVDARYRSAAMGFFQAAYSVGLTLGPVAMGVLADSVGLLRGFDAVAALCMAGAVFALRVM